ncbi:hypothetical protein [Pseudoduganella sp. R-34]|uniref:hypothetical protein n=1 Tax=Pseudoduganella sp. R-34 TaxID=3404062 RepID=UPI003CED56E4
MSGNPLNYAQITAATRAVIHRESERCKRELKMDRNYAHVEDHQNIAYGSLALWEELTLGRDKQDDRLHLNGMIEAIGRPEDKG